MNMRAKVVQRSFLREFTAMVLCPCEDNDSAEAHDCWHTPGSLDQKTLEPFHGLFAFEASALCVQAN